MRKSIFFACLFAAGFALAGARPCSAPGPGQGYATDAYPGFDTEESIVSPSKKEPKWFAFINGPNRENPADQYAYCLGLLQDGDASKAAKQLDALVRGWPQSEEAPKAQQLLAETLLGKLADPIEAFAEYRYLIDFYSLQCDFNALADRLYATAGRMLEEGKRFIWFRFDNTVDVRRAFEACVVRAPGAKWTPKAMLTVAELREKEGKPEEAVKVYENLRNLYAGTPEAVDAYYREAKVRVGLLEDHEYNRSRCQDTINFMKLALRNCEVSRIEEIKGMLESAEGRIEAEAYAAAKFYDSRTRTPRSAINAYERFLSDYPAGEHADAVRARLEELKGAE